jgi:hypothetical protein
MDIIQLALARVATRKELDLLKLTVGPRVSLEARGEGKGHPSEQSICQCFLAPTFGQLRKQESVGDIETMGGLCCCCCPGLS